MAVPTFLEAATKTYEAMKPRWKNDKVTVNWWQQMERHAFGRLGSMLVTKIQREDVLAVLVPLWTSRPETGRRIRRNIKVVLGWCQAHGFITVNFCRGSDRRGAPSVGQSQGPFPGVAILASIGSPRYHRTLDGVRSVKVVLAHGGLDGRKKWRSTVSHVV